MAGSDFSRLPKAASLSGREGIYRACPFQGALGISYANQHSDSPSLLLYWLLRSSSNSLMPHH
jgi:hypothetical protein